MAEWIEDYEQMMTNPYKESPYRKGANKVDNLIKYCEKCDCCWESYWCAKGKQWTKYAKNHIPLLNKKRGFCPPCKEKEKKNGTNE